MKSCAAWFCYAPQVDGKIQWKKLKATGQIAWTETGQQTVEATGTISQSESGHLVIRATYVSSLCVEGTVNLTSSSAAGVFSGNSSLPWPNRISDTSVTPLRSHTPLRRSDAPVRSHAPPRSEARPATWPNPQFRGSE